jgi:hypothetical protein
LHDAQTVPASAQSDRPRDCDRFQS